MIEQGLVKLIQADSTVRGLTPSGGGFFVQLPKGQNLPSWSYFFMSDQEPHALKGERGLTMQRLQVDCFGTQDNQGADAIKLAKAIDNVLDSFSGILTDVDSTVVDSILRSDKMDFFDDAGRTYRRMLEYEVWYLQ